MATRPVDIMVTIEENLAELSANYESMDQESTRIAINDLRWLVARAVHAERISKSAAGPHTEQIDQLRDRIAAHWETRKKESARTHVNPWVRLFMKQTPKEK